MDLMALGIGDESIVYIVLQLTISFEHYYNLYLQIILKCKLLILIT